MSLFTFIELQPFAAVRDRYLTDEEFAELQSYLAMHPEAGDVIPRSGGCRKLRWSAEGRGKRGGVRVIYFLRLRPDRSCWWPCMLKTSGITSIPEY